MTVINITLPPELLRKFDAFINSRGYYSLSEAFRDAVRSLMGESELAIGRAHV